MITTPVHSLPFFCSSGRAWVRLWHSPNAMRGGRRADAASRCLPSAGMQFPVASLCLCFTKAGRTKTPPPGPRCQCNQCDQLHVPLSVGGPVAHATCGPRSWMRIDWWRIPGPSKRLCMRVQRSESSSDTIHRLPHGTKQKPRRGEPPAAAFLGDFQAHFCHPAPMEPQAFGFRLRANAPEGQKQFPC